MSSESIVPSTPGSEAPMTPCSAAFMPGDASLLTEHEVVSERCCTCHKAVDAQNSLCIVRSSSKAPEVRRCRSCHNVRGAIERLKKNNGNLVQDWTKVDGDRLKNFYLENAHLRGPELLKKVEEVVTDWKTSITRFQFEADGEYMDEIDIREKYKSKPEILENILRNARRFFCPVKKVTMYADPRYTSKVTDTTEIGHTDKRKGQAALMDETAQPPSKKGKLENKKGKNQGSAGGDEEPKLKASMKNKLNKKMENVNTKILQLKDLLAKCTGFGDMIPAYVITAANNAKLTVEETINKGKACVDSGKGDVNPILEELEGNLSLINECFGRLKSQVEAAENFK